VAQQAKNGGKLHMMLGKSVNNKLCANHEVDRPNQKSDGIFYHADTYMGDIHSNKSTEVEMATSTGGDQYNTLAAKPISISQK
jgi:hypothetical protein